MSRRRTNAFYASTGLLLLLQQGGAQVDVVNAEKVDVVKLRVSRQGQSAETAAGIYIGRDQTKGYIITAYHAIAAKASSAGIRRLPNECENSSESREGPAPSIEVSFYSGPQAFRGTVFEQFEPGLDLGVVTIPLKNLPPNLHTASTAAASAETAVHIIGHPASGAWSIWGGRVLNENAAGADVHHFTTTTDSSLAAGFSGGPVFDSAGFLMGMHVCTVTTYGKATKIGDIMTQLAAWRVPIDDLINVQTSIPSDAPHISIIAKALAIRESRAVAGTFTILNDGTMDVVYLKERIVIYDNSLVPLRADDSGPDRKPMPPSKQLDLLRQLPLDHEYSGSAFYLAMCFSYWDAPPAEGAIEYSQCDFWHHDEVGRVQKLEGDIKGTVIGKVRPSVVAFLFPPRKFRAVSDPLQDRLSKMDDANLIRFGRTLLMTIDEILVNYRTRRGSSLPWKEADLEAAGMTVQFECGNRSCAKEAIALRLEISKRLGGMSSDTEIDGSYRPLLSTTFDARELVHLGQDLQVVRYDLAQALEKLSANPVR